MSEIALMYETPEGYPQTVRVSITVAFDLKYRDLVPSELEKAAKVLTDLIEKGTLL